MAKCHFHLKAGLFLKLGVGYHPNALVNPESALMVFVGSLLMVFYIIYIYFSYHECY